MRICFVRGVCTDCVGRSLVSWHHIGRPFCCRTCIRVENNMRRNNVCVKYVCVPSIALRNSARLKNLFQIGTLDDERFLCGTAIGSNCILGCGKSRIEIQNRSAQTLRATHAFNEMWTNWRKTTCQSEKRLRRNKQVCIVRALMCDAICFLESEKACTTSIS